MSFSCFWLDHYVIYIYFHFFVHHVMKQSGCCSLLSCSCILQSKGHHFIAIRSSLCDEDSLDLVHNHHHYLIIPWKAVYKRIHYQQSHLYRVKENYPLDMFCSDSWSLYTFGPFHLSWKLVLCSLTTAGNPVLLEN